MVIKLYVSRTSGNLFMNKQQDHIKRVLDSKQISYEEIDVADPHYVTEKTFMQNALKLSDEDLVALPPKIFKETEYRGDYEAFFTALENEHLFTYLDIDIPPEELEYELKHGPKAV